VIFNIATSQTTQQSLQHIELPTTSSRRSKPPLAASSICVVGVNGPDALLLQVFCSILFKYTCAWRRGIKRTWPHVAQRCFFPAPTTVSHRRATELGLVVILALGISFCALFQQMVQFDRQRNIQYNVFFLNAMHKCKASCRTNVVYRK